MVVLKVSGPVLFGIKTPIQQTPTCVVFSKGKADMTYTGEWLKKYNFNGGHVTYVISEEDDARDYAHTTNCNVVTAECSFNLASKRKWAIENLTTEQNPWLYFFEDNIKRVTCVDQDKYHLPSFEKTQRPWFHTRELSPQEVLGYMKVDIERCMMNGTFFGGYANNDNHFFRKVKYRNVAFVWSKMGYAHRNAPPWPTYVNEMDDYAMLGECLKRDGVVLVNNWLYPWTKKYEGRGGSRTLEERASDKRMAIDQMMMRFPGLFRVKDRKGRPTGTEIQLCFHSEKQVSQWQTSLSKK